MTVLRETCQNVHKRQWLTSTRFSGTLRNQVFPIVRVCIRGIFVHWQSPAAPTMLQGGKKMILKTSWLEFYYAKEQILGFLGFILIYS